MAHHRKQKQTICFTQTCEICLTDLPHSDFVSVCPLYHRYCRDCLTGFFTTHIKEGSLEGIVCPESSCTQRVIKPELVFSLIDKATAQRYDKILLNRALDAMNDVMWCPNRGCGNAVIVSLRKNCGRCSACDYCFCIRCKEAAHFGPCMNLKISEETAEWIREKTKQCPRCLIYIEKNGGCNHMNCTRCGLHFQWTDAQNRQTRPVAYVGGKTNEWLLGPNASRLRSTEAPKFPMKRCPNCGQPTEKNTTSNHMNCTNCRARFCFTCLALVKKANIHYSTASPCKPHSPLPAASKM